MMEHLILLKTELLTVLINLLEVLWYSDGIYLTTSWIYLIECSYDFINVIYHSNLYSFVFSIVKCHPKVVVNLASVGGHLS